MRKRLGSILGIAVLVMLTIVVLPARPAAACMCAGDPEDLLFSRADAVFTGRLVDRRDPDNSGISSSSDLASLRFEVDAVYKGEVAIDQVVVTAQGTESCGLGIEGEGPFLVFADRTLMAGGQLPAGMLHAISCSGTRPLAAGPPPPMFGTARPPTPPADGAQPSSEAPVLGTDTGSDAGSPIIAVGLGVVVIGGLIGGTAAVLRNRRRGAAGSAT